MSTAPPFDPAVFGGDPQTPPVPMVICWDELDPAGYARILRDLADWLDWLRGTYRLPYTVIPPCWFSHPGLREDLGHLWTGWLPTRHPDAGVGMTALDWDARREQTIARLREATAITGCTGTRHNDEPAVPDTDVSVLWNDHLANDAVRRLQLETRRAIIDVVTEHLQAVELRHDLAPGLLTEIAVDPAAATPDERAAVAARLQQIAERAATAVDQIAADAICTVTDQYDLAHREANVDAARRRVAEMLATVNAREPSGIDAAGARRDWLAAIENLVPATLAADLAAAAGRDTSESTERRTNAQRRHPHIQNLLRPDDGADSLRL